MIIGYLDPWGLGFRVEGGGLELELQVLGLWFQGLGPGMVSGVSSMGLGLGLGIVSIIGFQVSGLWFRVLGF